MRDLSSNLATPIFMSKPNQESSYNKYYENILGNHIGPIKNGVANNNFTYFTSVATQKNPFKQKQHMISGLNLFLLPQNLLQENRLDQSYVYVINYKLFYQDYLKSVYQNN